MSFFTSGSSNLGHYECLGNDKSKNRNFTGTVAILCVSNHSVCAVATLPVLPVLGGITGTRHYRHRHGTGTSYLMCRNTKFVRLLRYRVLPVQEWYRY
jgi:hypothetical protein